MDRYEMGQIMKAKQRSEMVAALKSTMAALLEKEANMRNLENLGEKNPPYQISMHNRCHTQGGYFLVDLYALPTAISSIMDHLQQPF
ncbi:unnamed protein product [Staurois parvus]|uniref:Small ribosomal subunit protein bS6m n=1 Tax=Staurois parvus TaxID=386267 RepID=A0ABN9E3H6_9NEOB|nr:unnamed protein product [Staurois parvus]